MRLTILVTLALAGLVAAPQAGAEAPPACGPATMTSHTNTTPTAIADEAVTTATLDVTGAGAYLTDVDLITDIRHTHNRDLDITLRSPAGTVVTITTDNGYVFNDEFAGTTFDDQANPGGQVPYATNTGVVSDTLPPTDGVITLLTPEEPLAAFHGENPNGTWTLTVSDDDVADVGTLNAWRLKLTTADCPSPPEKPPAGEKPAATGEPAGGTPPVAAAGSRLRVRADRLAVFAGAAARCRGAQGTCKVSVIARRRVIARGASDSARVPLRLTRAGRRLLAQRFGGARAKVVATDGDRRARTHTRAILAVERITTPPGSWVADDARLTDAGSRFVRRLHARLFGVASLRCDGYAALPEGTPRADVAAELSRARAAIVCGRDAEAVGHGSADPIASNADEAGRAANRRVEVTVRH